MLNQTFPLEVFALNSKTVVSLGALRMSSWRKTSVMLMSLLELTFQEVSLKPTHVLLILVLLKFMVWLKLYVSLPTTIIVVSSNVTSELSIKLDRIIRIVEIITIIIPLFFNSTPICINYFSLS